MAGKMSMDHLWRLGNSIKKWLVFAFFAVFVTACLPTSENPLPISAEAPLDRALFGAWIGNIDGEDEPVFLHFIETADQKTKAILVTVQTPEDTDGGWAEFDVTSSALPNGTFLNLYWRRSDGERVEDLPGIHLVRYRMNTEGALELYMINADLAEQAINEGALEGTVTSSGMTRSIRMTASSEDLAAYVSAQNPSELFSDYYGTFKPAL